VTLEIEEIDFAATGMQVFFESPGVYAIQASGPVTTRGTLTIGATLVPFATTVTTSWVGDATGPGSMIGSVTPDRVVLGYFDGGLYSGAGARFDVATVDGVTFSVASGINFWSLTYVPEPGAAALLATAGALAFCLRPRAGRSA
jgi:MprA protease rhombosortase-interaction domain-containing protein